ncbi:D-tyrosyl-tRNA(Tyr) deacylase [Actibacterium atlanticum]|uniref:D-aminoacyl-tRNA deacylase n=1 Tax=Actibacterium atlanticum TaxID=1461693 RepID=A0A058ZID5_9RHOB|nr:D-aminoacyl-tRNA deacylase [Actibacterium atlanticum]KCV80990.1 D-tyrosyl-tRNA(Tyr) deacylase [Actibacterium atlanticum]
MRAVVQRVSQAQVDVAGQTIGQIGPGLLVLVCAMQGDTPDNARAMAAKIAKLRVFKDDDGKMNLSLLQTGGSALVVSQFTLAGDTSRGNRPGFSTAAPPALGKALYEQVVQSLRDQDIETHTGQFGADMAVSLVNDGPVTLWVDL